MVDIRLPAGGGRRVTVQRLIAPSLAAKTGVTLGGRAYAENTTTGQPRGGGASRCIRSGRQRRLPRSGSRPAARRS